MKRSGPRLLRVVGERHRLSRAGFSLVEIIVVIAITALLLINVQLVSKAGTDAARSGVLMATIDDELDLTLDRMTLALMGSSSDELSGPPMAPANSTFVTYTSVLGFDDGAPVLGDTESIEWSIQGDMPGTVVWSQGESESSGRAVTWSRSVPNAYAGEALGNLEDDNGNGLLNEHGLAFTREGAKVEIHLTVEHVGDGGERAALDKTHRITCRN